MPFLFTHTQSTSRKVLVYLEGMLPSGSFLLQRMRHFEKQNTCSDGLFFFLCFLFSHDTQHASSGYHGGNWREVKTICLRRALIWQHPTPWVLPYSFSSHFLVPHPLTHITQPNLHGLMAALTSYKSEGSNYTTLLQSLPLTCENPISKTRWLVVPF